MAADEHPLFRSTEHDGPFPRCCSCSLPFDEVPYQVSKHFKKDEPIIEFAICLDCNMNLVEEFSEESKAAAQRFYTTELTFDAAQERVERDGDTIENWVACCNVCERERAKLDRYSLNARFEKSNLLYEPPPICLCEKCEERFSEGLSKKTREIRDGFMKDHVIPDPTEARKLPSGPKPATV